MIKEESRFKDSCVFEGMTSIRALIDNLKDEKYNARKIEKILYDMQKEKSKSKELGYLKKMAELFGFTVEGATSEEIDSYTVGASHGGIIALCAERVAGLNMYIQSGQTVVKRMIAFRKEPPKENGGMPCGACREFFLQLSDKNKDMEILTDYESRKTVTLNELMPGWWGWKRYNK